MRRFVLEGNIARDQHRHSAETEPAVRASLEKLLAEARRDLALFDSGQLGSKPEFSSAESKCPPSPSCAAFLGEFMGSPHPYLIIDPGPGLRIVDANDAYCAATMIQKSDVAGRPLFEVFPDNPDQQLADGVSNLFHSIQEVFRTRAPHRMAIQRYDIRNREGIFVRRWWKPANSPLFDERGEIAWILHHAEDVTAQMDMAGGEDAEQPARLSD